MSKKLFRENCYCNPCHITTLHSNSGDSSQCLRCGVVKTRLRKVSTKDFMRNVNTIT